MRCFILNTSLMVAMTSATICLAQSVNQETLTTPAGKEIRLGAYAVFKRDCSGGVAAQVQPAGDQRNGVLVITQGTLATTRVPNCGKIESPAQIVVYRPNPGFTGDDLVTFDVLDKAGNQKQTHRVSIKVSPP